MTRLIRWEPLREMDRMLHETDQLFSQWDIDLTPLMKWMPFWYKGDGVGRGFDIDLIETKGELVVKADIPDIDAKNIKVHLTGDRLTIYADVEVEEEREEEEYHIHERCYHTYHRTMRLPTAVDMDRAVAEYEMGVLTVTLPKVEVAVTKLLEVAPKKGTRPKIAAKAKRLTERVKRVAERAKGKVKTERKVA